MLICSRLYDFTNKCLKKKNCFVIDFTLNSTNFKHVFLETKNRCRRNRKVRKRCKHCYQSKSALVGSIQAGIEAKKITTLCIICNTYTCINCFNIYHKN